MTVQTITPEELERFSTNHPREILFHLYQLINDRERVSVMFNEGSEMILTVLLDIDEAEGLLIFDWGGSEVTNQKLLACERNFFVCTPHGVKNQFMTGAVRATRYQQRRAFVTRLPERYTRMQRREFFRMVLPLTRRPLCALPQEQGKPVQLPVIDISIGGIAIEWPAASSPFEIGQRIPASVIEFKDGQTLKVELEVRNVTPLQRGNKVNSRVGCQFIGNSHQGEHLLQRFISHVQREERRRLGL